jgi:hypothetical protein
MMEKEQTYVTIDLDRYGQIVSVRRDGREVEVRDGEGDAMELVNGKRVIMTLHGATDRGSAHTTAPSSPSQNVPSTQPDPERPPEDAGSDPCCIRDAQTGRLWCWC